MAEYELSPVLLRLPIKQAWLKEIYFGNKGEEYREIKPYWTVRFQNAGLLDEKGQPTGRIGEAVLFAGYGKNAWSAKIRFVLRIGEGRPEWGAEPGAKYYVLGIILLCWVKR